MGEGRLDRESSLRLFRCLIGSHRGLSHKAIDQARMALKNDRQFSQFQRSLRGEERRSREELLSNLKNLGIVDLTVCDEDLRHMI